MVTAKYSNFDGNNQFMKLIIINGPNLNLQGIRQTEIYGKETFEAFLKKIRKHYPDDTIEYYHSNVEGEIINEIQKVGFLYDGIILNAGGYSHTSISIADAIKAVKAPVVEVHISNIFSREPVRHTSLIAQYVKGSIMGFGLDSYRLAVESFRKA